MTLKTLILPLSLFFASLGVAQPSLTCVVDKLYTPENVLFSGKVTATQITPTVVNLTPFTPASRVYTINGGAVNVCLQANGSSSPNGTSYRMEFTSLPTPTSLFTSWTETWLLTGAGPLKVSQVRQDQTPAVQAGIMIAKGDDVGFQTGVGVIRVPIGPDGYVKTADSTAAVGWSWKTGIAGNAATATALAVDPANCSGNNFSQGIQANGTADCAQPGFSNLSGQLLASQSPAFTGDVTKGSGSFATTVTALNGTSLGGLATGLIKNTTSTGVPSIAVAGTDFVGGQGTLGTTNTLPKTTAAGILGPSAITDDGTNVTVTARNVRVGTSSSVTGADLSLNARLGFPDSVSGRGPFVFDYSQANVYNSTVDPALYFGYNLSATGGLITAGEPGLSFGIESNYNDGSGNNKMEAYLQYVGSDGVTSVRPLFFQINRTTNTVTGSSIVGPLSITNSAGSTYASFDTANSIIELRNSTKIKAAVNNVPVLQQVNAAGNNTLDLIKLDSSNVVAIDPGASGASTGGNFTVGGTLAVTGNTATLGGVSFLLKNGTANYVFSGTGSFKISNAAGNADLAVIDNTTGTLNLPQTGSRYQINGVPFFSLSGTTNYAWSGSTAWKISNAAGNADLVTVLNGGNVGIGTATPGQLLTLATAGGLGWGTSSVDTGVSRTSAGVVAIGNGTPGDVTGTLRAGSVGVGNTATYPFTVNVSNSDYASKIANSGGVDAAGGLWVDTRWNTTNNFVFRLTTNTGATEVLSAKGSANILIGGTTDGNYRLDIQKSGSTGTLRVYDQTASTGATTFAITSGAGQSTTPLQRFLYSPNAGYFMDWTQAVGTHVAYSLTQTSNSVTQPIFNIYNGELTIGKSPVTANSGYMVDIAKSTAGGTLRVYDQTATTGNTKLNVTAGAGQGTNPLVDVTDNAGTAHYVYTTGAGLVGLGTNNPLTKLDVVGNVFVGDSNGSNAKQLQLVYDIANDRGSIQAVHQNTGYTSLLLNQSGGNVGIGGIPAAKLDVNIGAHTTPATVSTYGYVLDDQASNSFGIGADASYAYMQSFSAKPLQINNLGNNILLVPGTTGNVGIGNGNTSPQFKLHVMQTVTAWPAGQIGISNSTAANHGLLLGYIYNSGVESGGSIQALDGGSATKLVLQSSGGNIGVKTTNPQQMLTLGATGVYATEMGVPASPAAALAAGGTLTVATPYYYKVTALDGVGQTIGSSEVTATPTSGNQTINVSWTAVTGAASYKVYRTTTAGTYGATSQAGNPTTTSFSDTGVTLTSGTLPTVTTAYGVKLNPIGNSWMLGGPVGIGTATPYANSKLNPATNDSATTIATSFAALFSNLNGSVNTRATIGFQHGVLGPTGEMHATLLNAGTGRTQLGFGVYSGSGWVDNAMVIDYTGNVGINTTNPGQAKLQIANDVTAANFTAGNVDVILQGATTTTKQLLFGFETENNYGFIQTLNSGTSFSTYNLGLQPKGGSVGIGTAAPVAKLEIIKDSTYSNESSPGLAIDTGTNGQPKLLMGADNTNTMSYIQSMSGGTSYLGVPLVLQPNGGNVGVGTLVPWARFHSARNMTITDESTYPGVFGSATTINKAVVIGYDTASDKGIINAVNHGTGWASLALVSQSGNVLVGGTTEGNYKLDVQKSGTTGTARVYDQTATTGVTTLVVQAGAGQSTTSLVQVLGVDGAKNVLVSGTTKGIRFGHSSTQSLIEGVDFTGTGSHQPLFIGGSDVRFGTSGTETVRLISGGMFLIGATADSGSGTLLQVAGHGIQIIGGTQPTCNAAHRGEINVVGATHSAGVKDSVVVCAADVADAYSWRTVY